MFGFKKSEEKKKSGCLKTGCALVVVCFIFFILLVMIASTAFDSYSPAPNTASTPPASTPADQSSAPASPAPSAPKPTRKPAPNPQSEPDQSNAPSQTPPQTAPDAPDSTPASETTDEPSSANTPSERNPDGHSDDNPANDPAESETTSGDQSADASGDQASDEDTPLQSAYRKRAKALYEQLIKAQRDPDFAEYGFGDGGPYSKWMDSANHLKNDCSKNKDKLKKDFIDAVIYFPTIGLEILNHPEGTNLTKEYLPKIKDQCRSQKDIRYKAAEPKANAGEAITFIKETIKLHLKSPKSADFSFFDISDHLREEGHNTFSLNSYVDAKNSFNAEIRVYFSIRVQKKNGHWEVLSLSMDE